MSTVDEQYKRLRSYLNPLIQGPNTDAVLTALATGSASYLIDNVTAVHDSLYIVTAQGKYLDERLAEFGITRPPAVGLSDAIFRQIGLEVKNRKQVRDLISKLLNILFGDEYTRATISASKAENYNLQDGDTLIIKFDDKVTISVPFHTNDFENIAAAKAQEVSDAITKYLRSIGVKGTAITKDDGNGPYIQILSDTLGSSSSVSILGGRAQNKFLFDSIVPVGGNASTQWSLTRQPGGIIRFTWTGKADPQIGKLNIGNYVNVYGGGFGSSSNEGSFTIVGFSGGAAGLAYFDVVNPLGTTGPVTQGTNDALMFFNPTRKTLANQLTYAAVYQTEPRILQLFIPPSTKVIRRDRIGAAHIHDQSDPISLLPNQYGPYIYDLTQPFTVSSVGTTLTQNLDATMPKIISVADASQFPDTQGNLIIDYGFATQEGPIPFIARPSSNTLLLSPAYTIKQSHTSGAEVSLIASKSAANISSDGLDYPFYVTDVASGRLYAQDLINSIVAAGITVVFNIRYPNDVGLGKQSTIYSEIASIWS